MKKFLTLLCFLGCSLFASAQCEVSISIDSSATGLVLTANTINNLAVSFVWNTGETTQTIDASPAVFDYCVTAVFADGCAATACFQFGGNACGVFIQTIQGGSWLQAVASGDAPFTYEWSNGFTNAAIPISPNDSLLCVIITDASGCTSTDCIEFFNDCSVTIDEQSTPIFGTGLVAEASGSAPYTYIWSSGEVGATIFPNAPGFFCVTVTDATGCEASACYQYTGGANNCSVYITADSVQVGVPGAILFANAVGTSPFVYEWSTGENTAGITVSESGTYCVTVVDANGCESSNCYDYVYEACGGYFVFTTTGSGGELCVVAEGVVPFTYAWETGETTDCISITTSGIYTVVITDAEGCVFAITGFWQVQEYNYQLRGLVYPADSANVFLTYEGWAYRIGMNADGTASLIDSVALESSLNGTWYDFGDVDAGDYLVKVALTEGSPGYEENMPTYHYSSLTWGAADVIAIPSLGFNSYDVWMIYGDNPGGPGGIYGSVIVGDGFVIDPIPNVSILLFNEFGEPVAYALTDGNGEFAFPDLAWGTYQVWIDIPGQEAAWYWVTIGPDSPTATGLVFEVSETGITTNINEILDITTFNTYPNPTADQLIVNFNVTKAAAVQISLTSLTGQTLLLDNQVLTIGGQTVELDLTNIPTGIYFLNIANGNDVISKKIVKK